MSYSDQDIELLESYLDGELADAESVAVRSRLSSEPDLAGLMDDLRSQREWRTQFFSALEPDGAVVDQFVDRVYSAADREVAWGRRNTIVRWGSAVAACLLIGFVGGYSVRTGGTMVELQQPESDKLVAVQQLHNPFTSESVGSGSHVFPGGLQATGYAVPIRGSDGQITRVQYFRTEQEAQEFIGAAGTAQRSLGAGVRLIGDEVPAGSR